MRLLFWLGTFGALLVGLALWYRRETSSVGDAMVHLQSAHEHLHLHVDLPQGMVIQPGDTVELLDPQVTRGLTGEEVSYPSRVRLTKASGLRRYLVQRSSLVELSELVEHP